MKRFLTILLALHLITCSQLLAQWVWQNPTPQGNDIYYVKMFNSGTGYAAAYGSLLKTTNTGNNWTVISNDPIGVLYFTSENTGYAANGNVIFKTTNGAAAWLNTYSFTDFYPNFFKWQNDLTGFAMQYSPSSSPEYYKTKIYRTTTGGTSWHSVFNDTTINITSISFPSVSAGYMTGNTKNNPFVRSKFFKTTNNGITWDSIQAPNIRSLNSVSFINNNTGYVSGSNSQFGASVIKTTNGGASWDSVFFSQTNFSELEFTNVNTGYGLSGSLRKTTNGGVNWAVLNTIAAYGLGVSCFSIYNGNNLYLGGPLGDLGKSTDGGVNWTADSKGYDSYLYSIKFFDVNTGIAVGGDTHNGIIFKTTNAGLVWDTVTLADAELNNVQIKGENTAYIAGTGCIFKTTNKGQSFTRSNTFMISRWDDISFPNDDTGYVINKYTVIDKTTNGGVNWFNIHQLNGSEYFTICFVNGTTGFYGGSRIYKTTNGGQSWDSVNTGIVNGFYFCNRIRHINNILYSIGTLHHTFSPNIGVLLKSTDLGQTWATDSSMQDSDIHDISIPSPNIIYIMGSQFIHKSVNSGAWMKFNPYISSNYYNSLHFTSNDTGYILTYRGGILKTTNGGGMPIGINIGSNEIPDEYNLYQNYPNPFNPVTTIRFGLPKDSQVSIKIYDILGRLVKLLVNESRNAGSYSLSFDGSQYASGVYFYTIETPDFVQSKKMVLLK